jgi:hypothetical protein
MDIGDLILLFTIGMIAQLVDGTLGMGYGVTSSTLLISMGVYPAIASASVHTAEVVVSLASGVSHLRLGNVRRDLLLPLAGLGVIGGILGAWGLVDLPGTPVRLIVGLVLLAMGGVIFYRFAIRGDGAGDDPPVSRPYSPHKLAGLGFFAAFIDAIGGGGWGPICTPSLIITGSNPREAVGSVNLAEFFVTVAITLTFMVLIGLESFRWDIVLALVLAGLVTAPLAAWLCHRLPRRVLGILVGLLVIILSLRTIALTLQ